MIFRTNFFTCRFHSTRKNWPFSKLNRQYTTQFYEKSKKHRTIFCMFNSIKHNSVVILLLSASHYNLLKKAYICDEPYIIIEKKLLMYKQTTLKKIHFFFFNFLILIHLYLLRINKEGKENHHLMLFTDLSSR